MLCGNCTIISRAYEVKYSVDHLSDITEVVMETDVYVNTVKLRDIINCELHFTALEIIFISNIKLLNSICITFLLSFF